MQNKTGIGIFVIASGFIIALLGATLGPVVALTGSAVGDKALGISLGILLIAFGGIIASKKDKARSSPSSGIKA